MRIYLAARHSRRWELNGYAKTLRDIGYTVTSRWLDGSHQSPDATEDEEALKLKRQWAVEDMTDIDDAHVVIIFSEEPRTEPTRGGRHVETGYALSEEKELILVGPVENVFHALSDFARFREFGEDLLECLKNIGYGLENRR